MGLSKGNTNNPHGRPVGAKNKFTVEVKERIIDILDNNFTIDSVNEDLKQLESKDRLQFLLKLLDYTTPKMKQTEINANVHNEDIIVIPPTWDERETRINELKAKLFED